MARKQSRANGPDGSPWEPVRAVLQTLEQAAATGWYPARRELLNRLASVPRPDLPVWVPEADVDETPRDIEVSFALPGVEKDAIRLTVTEESVTVRGRRAGEKTPAEHSRRELPRGEFLRRVTLPAEVKPASARAAYRNGILRVTLPRARAAFGRSVKVE